MKTLKRILKYLAKVISLTLLTIVIIVGLALLFVFVSAKISNSKGQNPPINLYTIISPSMTPNINVYDVVVTVKTKAEDIKVGDVITFYSDNPNLDGMTITHRVMQIMTNGTEFGYQTKGDYNKDVDISVAPYSKVVGKVIFKVPQLGKVQFFLASKGGWIIAILIPALAIIAYDIYKIIKLILIKQKILDFQKQEDLNQDKENIVTIDDIYKDEENYNKKIEQSVQNTELPKKDEYIPKDINIENYNKNIDENIQNTKLPNQEEYIPKSINTLQNNSENVENNIQNIDLPNQEEYIPTDINDDQNNSELPKY